MMICHANCLVMAVQWLYFKRSVANWVKVETLGNIVKRFFSEDKRRDYMIQAPLL